MFIDPIHIAFPRRPSQHRQINASRESINSSSSTSSYETPSPRKRSLTDSESCNSPFIRSDNSLASPTSPVNLINSCEVWPRRSKGPVMRLCMKAPTLEMIPDSSSPDKTTFPHSPRRSPDSDALFTQCSVIPDKDFSLRNSTTPNAYNITSLSSLRKQKMDRLRKKLGQDVPFDLVFPSSDSGSERSISPILPSSTKEFSVLLPPPPTPRRKDSGRLSNARDSIVGCASVHHAKRQAVTKQTLSHASTKSEFFEPKRLSFIIESPNEHGVGCAQDFGQPHELELGAEFSSEWSVSAGTEVKLWSTRRGYEGWRPNPPSKTLQSPPTTPYSLPPSPSKSVPSNTEPLKKKPPSYRKPVPRLLE